MTPRLTDSGNRKPGPSGTASDGAIYRNRVERGTGEDPRGCLTDFQDEQIGEWWVAIREPDMEALLDKVGKDAHAEEQDRAAD